MDRTARAGDSENSTRSAARRTRHTGHSSVQRPRLPT